MLIARFRNSLGIIAVTCLLGAGPVMADEDQSDAPELPEAVAELVGAMSGVQRVEAAENGTFKVHRQMEVTGSRIMRDVTLRIAEDGTVLDWGRTPMYSRTYTIRELRDTGRADLAEALIKLDPAIQGGGSGR